MEAGAVAGALRDLWPVVAGLTVLEGITLIDRRSLLGGALLGGAFRLKGPGVRWAALGPLDRAYSLRPETVLLGPRRVHFLTAPDLGGARRFRPDYYRSFPYDELDRLTLDGTAGRLTLPDGTALPVASAAAGRALVERIERLRALPPESLHRRHQALAEDARARLDPAALPRRRESLGALSKVLATFAATAFGWTLLVIPVVVYKPGVPVSLALPLLAGFAALHAATATAGVLLAKRLRRNGLATPRGTLLGVLLYPPATLRSATFLPREIAAGLDPLAVLAAEAASREIAAPLRADLHGVEQALANSLGDDDWRAAWTIRRAALDGLLAHLGTTREVALAPPEREDPTATHYCPFCESEFQPGAGECPDCLGGLVELGSGGARPS